MGNSATIPSTTIQSLNGKKIFDLSDVELRHLLRLHPWTKGDLYKVAQSLQPVEISGNGFYSRDDTPETDLAMRLNTLSKEIASLRFQLVPSLVKEPMFWEGVFAILRERLVEHNASFQLQSMEEGDDEETEEYEEEKEEGLSTTNGGRVQGHPPNDADTDRLVRSLRAQMAAKDQQIVELQSQIETLQKTGLSQTTSTKHVGKWMMDKDSEEFLQFPDEIKENMRKEKQRRLKQVQQDMKFILDSDSIEHSNGYWTCCDRKEYLTSCPKATNSR